MKEDSSRCRICWGPYLGSAKPTHCAFCGARQRHIVAAADYEPTGIAELSRRSRENLEHALAQQVDNSMFYRGASKVADTEEGKALFAAMAAMEERHAEIVCRVLVVAVPEDLRDTGACSPAHKENLIEARKRRERASKVYGKFLGEATEERVREILEAFIEIQGDHLSVLG